MSLTKLDDLLETCRNFDEAMAGKSVVSGVRAGHVEYRSCQPWPFPSSLMIGCFAEALSEEIHLDGQELAEARWVSREDVAKSLEKPGSVPGVGLPPPFAIAHHLLRDWVRS